MSTCDVDNDGSEQWSYALITTTEKHKEQEEIMTCNAFLYSCFLVVFNFVLFSVVGADEVFTGQLHADDVCGRPKVHDDGTFCHRDKGKAIINGCTDGSIELPLR